MKKKRIKAKVADLILNEGQLPWLPKNPRQWTRTDLDNLKASMERDPDFMEDRPALVVAFEDKLLVFGGNMRSEVAKELKRDVVDAVLYTPENDTDHETIKRRAVLDNGSFGAWDYDSLANEWGDLPLAEWGVPAWENQEEKMPSDLDAEPKNAPFVCKITFPDADAMTKFVMTYKDIIEEEYPGVVISESGGEL